MLRLYLMIGTSRTEMGNPRGALFDFVRTLDDEKGTENGACQF